MSNLDWFIVILYFGGMLGVGLAFARRGSRSVDDYFLSGRNLPWWVIGLSAVATYSDAGLAPAVTMLTYQGGLLGNAVWWIPYVIWMPLSAVLWSRYWRRLRTLTSAELLEVRYRGDVARIYRGVYAVLMSFGFIVVLMAYSSGWLVAAAGPILGWEPVTLMVCAGVITLAYTATSGLSGVAYTDACQFGIFLAANIALIVLIVAQLGGMPVVYDMISENRGAATAQFFDVIPPAPDLVPLSIFAFAVQGLFFAASPTGGEGYTAQRFMAARNEFHAQVGQLANTVLTLIVRVVPFLFFGLVATALFPLGQVAEPGELWAMIVHDYAPPGLLGLLVAGLTGAFMATLSTEMNWGASYVVNDVYRPFLAPGKDDHHYVWAGRVSSIALFLLSLIVAYFFIEGLRSWFLFINSIVFAFVLPLSWLRFFWWRLNIYGEAAALVIGLPLSYVVWFPLGFSNPEAHPFWHGFLLLFGLGLLTIVVATLLTRPEPEEVLTEFYLRCRPPGFWGPIASKADPDIVATIRTETKADLVDCAAGVACCATSVLAIISMLGLHWTTVASSLAVAVLSGGFCAVRWQRRGVFRSLSGNRPS